MASLKEVKARMASVKSTGKITSAMKMVASAKLHKAQKVTAGMLPYEERLHQTMEDFLAGCSEKGLKSPLTVGHDNVGKVAIVACSSNGSLCGAFNSNAIRGFMEEYDKYKEIAGPGGVEVYTAGRKMLDAVRRAGITPAGDYSRLVDNPEYEECAALADKFMERYLRGELDKVVIVYHHFKGTGSQILTTDTYLPLELDIETNSGESHDYIFEPTLKDLMQELVPRELRLRLYATILDTVTSEHAARMIAMQTATDNADDLLGELTLTYNKSRQQAITAELLDIMGGMQDN